MRSQVRAVSNSTFKPSVRYIRDLCIYFKDKETVYVSDGKTAVLFDRWFDDDIGFYSECWKPFCRVLLRRDSFKTIYDIYRVASFYGIHSVPTTKSVEIPSGIKIHAESYNDERRRNAKAKNN